MEGFNVRWCHASYSAFLLRHSTYIHRNHTWDLVSSIEIAKSAIFSTYCAISFVMRAHFFCEGAAQRINKHYLRMRWINPISVIIASSEFIEESLFDNNSKCEDCECTVAGARTVVRLSLIVFDPVTKRCRRCPAMNIPSFGRKKAKKNLGGKGGRKVNPPPPHPSRFF